MTAKSTDSSAGSSAKKIVDVAKPGDTPADATSRPVIVGHKKTMKEDPMVVSADTTEEATPQTLVAPSANKTSKVKELQAIQLKKDDADKTDPQEATPDIPEETQQDDAANEEEVGVNPALVSDLVQNVGSKKEQSIAEQEREKRDQQVETLVASKKYFVKTKLPKGKRHMRIVLFLLLVAVVAAAWFLTVGPGREFVTSQTSLRDAAKPAIVDTAAKPEVSTQPGVPSTKTFNDPKYGIQFTYPGTWNVEVGEDKKTPGRTAITLTSQKMTVKTAYSSVDPVDAEVQVVAKIYVQPQQMSGSGVLTACTTESIVVDDKNLNLVLASSSTDTEGVGFVTLIEGNCVRKDTTFTVKDDLVLSKLPQTEHYVRADFIYTKEALAKIGASTPQQIEIAQQTGVVVDKEQLKKTAQYTQLVEILKSVKSL